MTTRTAVRDLCAADLMQRNLITVHADDPVREIERVLVDAQVSSVPVLDECGAVLGVVSMRDVVRRYAESDEPADADNDDDGDDGEFAWAHDEAPRAADLMATDFVQVAPRASIAEMARMMVDATTHRVLVVERERLLGLVSSMDVLRAIADERDQI